MVYRKKKINPLRAESFQGLLAHGQPQINELDKNEFFIDRKEIKPWHIHLRIWFLKVVGLNYSPEETLKILSRMNFEKFMDDSFGVLRDINRLTTEYGWYKGDYFRKWIGDLIAKKTGKPDTTFAQAMD